MTKEEYKKIMEWKKQEEDVMKMLACDAIDARYDEKNYNDVLLRYEKRKSGIEMLERIVNCFGVSNDS